MQCPRRRAVKSRNPLDVGFHPFATSIELQRGIKTRLSRVNAVMQETIGLEPDFDWHLTNIVDTGSTVAAERTTTFTGDCPTGGHVVGMHSSGRGASVAVIENGRIK